MGQGGGATALHFFEENDGGGADEAEQRQPAEGVHIRHRGRLLDKGVVKIRQRAGSIVRRAERGLQ